MMDEHILKTDILVIGCGIAGASAALEAAKSGMRLVVITKNRDPVESNTYYAQGGIVSLGHNDDPELLMEDILQTGDGINNPEAVGVLAREGKDMVEDVLIKELKIPFAKSSPDELDYAQEAGHTRRRILHIKDTTGKTIEEKFIQALKAFPNVTLLSDHTAVDLLTVPHHSKNPTSFYRESQCIGAYVLDNQNSNVKKGPLEMGTEWPTERVPGWSIWNISSSIPHRSSIEMRIDFLFRRQCGGKVPG